MSDRRPKRLRFSFDEPESQHVEMDPDALPGRISIARSAILAEAAAALTNGAGEGDEDLIQVKLNLGDDAPTPRWVISPAIPGDPDAQGHPLRWDFEPGKTGLQPPESDDFYRASYEHLRQCLGLQEFRWVVGDYVYTKPDLMRALGNIDDPIPSLKSARRPVPVPKDKDGGTRDSGWRSGGATPPQLPQSRIHENFPFEGLPSDPHSPLRPVSRPFDAPRIPGDASNIQAWPSDLLELLEKYSRRRLNTTGNAATEDKGECKWIWFLVIVLVLSMFLCLFLYVFKIIK
ncbi:hypothetical protein BO71DRAFT_488109 [Aspergillus ellipticus CBS 707.79]|uniref:Uncharacterized protein n=1 Tax=Aspergillus ellipticus CBS 707.79 TaxID=1448320 RepID=A0A319DDX6_9EURO|nr:hypothetical protein BO71DRAFT_488109 [Aspergillus ellipticus CBS 707.79]